MSELSQDVIIRASEGDIDAFEEIYKLHVAFIYNVAFRIVDNHEDTKEVSQDVLMKIHQKLKDFNFESSIKTWIYRVTVNTAIDYVRKVSKKRKATMELNEILISNSSNNEEMDQEQFENIFRVLKPDQKACLILRSVEGLSYQEISDTLKININTVRSRIRRARESLFALRKEVT